MKTNKNLKRNIIALYALSSMLLLLGAVAGSGYLLARLGYLPNIPEFARGQMRGMALMAACYSVVLAILAFQIKAIIQSQAASGEAEQDARRSGDQNHNN